MADPTLDRYRQLLDRRRVLTAAALVRAWRQLDNYDEDAVDRYATLVAPVLNGAKVATVAATSAFVALRVGFPPVAVAAAQVEVAANTMAPFLAYWHGLSVGRDWVEAHAAGTSVAEAAGADFVQSVARRTGDAVAEAAGVDLRWERVPEPGACDWCREVAGARYLTAESADFGHERCFCDVVPAA